MNTSPWHRAPELRWHLVFAVALTCALVAIAGLELWVRGMGVEPSVTDDTSLYGRERAKAYGDDLIALVGTSRFQVALDPEQIDEAFDDHRVANLSVIGQSALPVLEELASDESFRGVVVVEFMPIRMFTPDATDVDKARDFLKRYDALAAYSPLETNLRLMLQSNLALLHPQVKARGLAKSFFGHEISPHQRFLSSRFAPRDYTGQDLDAVIALRKKVWPERFAERFEDDALDAQIKRLNEWTDAIQNRGGHVVFFRINSSGFTADLEEEYFPRAEYWDRFAEQTTGTAVHFDDVASLREIELPEGSHADVKDTETITDGLIQALRPVIEQSP